jgi:hypothetical protein
MLEIVSTDFLLLRIELFDGAKTKPLALAMLFKCAAARSSALLANRLRIVIIERDQLIRSPSRRESLAAVGSSPPVKAHHKRVRYARVAAFARQWKAGQSDRGQFGAQTNRPAALTKA